jgi:predicted extracellular nuclease
MKLSKKASARKKASPILHGLLCSAALVPLAAHADVYFSEYVEGSSNNKALEIYNSGNAAVNLSGYKIEGYFNGSTTANASFTINLSGSIPAKGVFVVAPTNANATILGKANQTFGSAWFNGDDAIVLKNGNTIIDSFGQIGVDPGNEWGSGLTSGADNTLRRKTTVTTGDTNATDSFDPALQWDGFAMDSFDDLGVYNGGSSGPGNPPQTGGNCGDARTLISAVQGTGTASPLNGSTVSVEAIVTGNFQNANQLGGFFIQQADGEKDNNSLTSEGLYVSGGSTAVQAGDRVRVTGAVAETFDQTQIVATAVAVCANNQALPAAVAVNLPVATAASLEAYEGMRVTLPQTLTVTETFELGRFGQVLLSNGRLMQPTNVVAPGAAANALQAQNNLNQILLDDGSNVQNPDPVIFPAPALSASNTLRGGDTVSNIVGILSYDFGAYRVTPTTAPTFVHSNPRPAAPVSPTGTNLRVASFNLLNFFNGNGLGGGFPTARGATNAAEFARQKAKTVNAILGLNVDVIGVTELENDGFGPYSAIAQLVDFLNAASGSNNYAFVNPGLSKIGTDEIVVGFIYRSDRVATVGSPAILDSSVAPLFVDTKNRPVLAQTFREKTSNGVVTVAINHLKSKGSDCLDLGDADTGDGQGNCAVTRTNAANALVSWLATDPTHSGDKDYLIIGDLNAYAQENPITAIKAGGYSDLIAQFGGANAYSYVFDGQAGYLDHALASSSLTPQATGAVEWHINADEPIALDYNTDYQSAGQVVSLYSSAAYRSSDHDPLVVALKLSLDLDGDGDVDNDDINIVVAARNTVAAANDPRDINRDGVINANDARALTLQCTRPRCATN